MDERQAQITEGAGLEDSRINTEFIEFLSKWSTPFFILLLVLAGGLFGYRKLEERRIAAIDQAFIEYELTVGGGNPSPTSLQRIIDDFHDTRSVGLMAQMNLADLYYNSARAGVDSGASVDPVTGELDPESILTQDEIASYLQSSGRIYSEAMEKAESEGKPVFAVSAAFGSAAVLASQGDTDGARSMYERAGVIASAAQFGVLEQVAADRAAAIDSVPVITLYNEADLPELPNYDPILDEILDPSLGVDGEPPVGIAPVESGTPTPDDATTDPAATDPEADADSADANADASPTDADETSDNPAAGVEGTPESEGGEPANEDSEPPTEGDDPEQP